MLESAFNIVYGLPNRPFLRGKSSRRSSCRLALVLFVAFVSGRSGGSSSDDFPDSVDNAIAAYAFSVLVSTCAVFLFLVSRTTG